MNFFSGEYVVKSNALISTFNLGFSQTYLDECVNEIYKIGDKQNNSTNVKALMTSYYIWEDSLVFSRILSVVKSVLIEVLSYEKDKYQVSLDNAWGSIYKKGEFAEVHHHKPFHYSFVFYLRANHLSSPLNFVDSNLNIYPEDNLLVLFPSYVAHQVLPNEDNERVMIAGNFSVEVIPHKEKQREVKIHPQIKEGKDYIDIREYTILEDGSSQPTNKGISIPKSHISKMIKHLNTIK